MATIEAIKFGKNLRPTTVESVKKINELITAVNKFDVATINALQTDVKNLKTTVTTHTSQISTANSSINGLKQTASTHTADIDKIKITLYTPLAADEDTE